MKYNYLQPYLVEGAYFSEEWEFPILKPCHEIPDGLISFSKTKGSENFNQYVHFYEVDEKIFYEVDEKILPFGKNPRNYFPCLSQFEGAIGCDFSVCRDLPFIEQASQTNWNRKLTYWLQNRGISVVPNVRFGDERSYKFCFEGIPKNSVISVGTLGCTKNAYFGRLEHRLRKHLNTETEHLNNKTEYLNTENGLFEHNNANI